VPTVDTVRVLRGATGGKPLYGRPAGEQELVLEIWTTHEDPTLADDRLEALESAVAVALETVPRDGTVMKIDVLSIDPDSDLFRPTVGSRMNIRVIWRKKLT